MTLSRVSCRRLPLLFSAFDTVPTLTLEARATSWMVSRVRGGRGRHGGRRSGLDLVALLLAHGYFTTPLRKPET